MRVTSLLIVALVVGAGGCSKPHEPQPQPDPHELRRLETNLNAQEEALANAQREEAKENAAEALNQLDRNVQNAKPR